MKRIILIFCFYLFSAGAMLHAQIIKGGFPGNSGFKGGIFSFD